MLQTFLGEWKEMKHLKHFIWTMPKPKLLLFISHFETEQANLLPQGQEQKCSFKLKEGNSACFFHFMLC